MGRTLTKSRLKDRRKPFVPPMVNPCANCGGIHNFVWVTLPDKSTLCFKCFESLHPADAAINRFKKPNNQLEIPLWDK